MKTKYIYLLLSLVILGCIEKPEVQIETTPEIGSAFDFKSMRSVAIDLSFTDNLGLPFTGLKVLLWKTEKES
jgi:hypothetical protein